MAEKSNGGLIRGLGRGLGGLVAAFRSGLTSGLANPEPWLIDALGGDVSVAGPIVTRERALQLGAVYACVKILSETFAQLPLHLYRRLDPRGKGLATDHALYPILHDQVNAEMSSFEFREFIMRSVLLSGDGLSIVIRNGGGQIVELWPMRPDFVFIWRDPNAKYALRYTYTSVGGTFTLNPDQVLHFRGPSNDTVRGLSVINEARETVGGALAVQEFGNRFFSNGAQVGGVIQVKQRLSDVAYKRLRSTWEARHQGLSEAHKTAILEEGAEWKQNSVPPDEAQFLEARKYTRTEIAGLFRVPPHMIGDLERATYTNIEHQGIDFVVYTMLPWLRRFEQAITRDLLTQTERKSLFAEFLVDGLLRGDIKSRYDAYAVGRQWGWLSVDDIREAENMNPLPDNIGDVYMTPLNMVPAGRAPEDPAAIDVGGATGGSSGADEPATAA